MKKIDDQATQKAIRIYCSGKGVQQMSQSSIGTNSAYLQFKAYTYQLIFLLKICKLFDLLQLTVSYMNTETFTPLVFSVIDDVLLKAMPDMTFHSVHVMNFSDADQLQNVYTNMQFTEFRSGWWSHKPDEIYKSLKQETLTQRLCARIKLTHCFARR